MAIDIPLKEFIRTFWRTWVVILAPVLLAPLIFQASDKQETEALKCAYVILLMATYWIAEVIPLPITAMIPLVALPLLGVMSTSEIAVNYLNATNYMFFGGLILAIAVEHCGLHNRIALKVIMLVGVSPARLMLGFMFTTMFLSMWISNTATTAMMLPIVDAVADAINSKGTEIDMAPLASHDDETEEAGEAGEEGDIDDELAEEDDVFPLDGPPVSRFLVSKIKDGTQGMYDHQMTVTSFNQMTLHSLNQMTIQSVTSDCPGNDPDSMVSYLPNVRRNTLDPQLSVVPRDTYLRRNTLVLGPGEKKLIRQSTTEWYVQNNDAKQSEDEAKDAEKGKVDVIVKTNEPISNKAEIERNFLLLAVAFTANIGGTGVLTGSPPNLVVPDVLDKRFGKGHGLSFATWMAFTCPVMLVNVLICWVWLRKLQTWMPGWVNTPRSMEREEQARQAIRRKYADLGRMTMHEFQVLMLFALLVLLWFFKTPVFMPGWGKFFDPKVPIGNATPAILMAILLFILPQTYNFWPFASMKNSGSSSGLITWRIIETKMCWGVIFFLGGGFALADATKKSGLSKLMVTQLNKLHLERLPSWVVNLIICFITNTFTNIASNIATANIVIPILAEMALTMCVHPIYFVLPAGMVCSCAFALPVCAAPNAIVFGHSTMKTSDMFKAGMFMNVVCVISITIAINTYGTPLFYLNEMPTWASDKLENASACGYVPPLTTEDAGVTLIGEEGVFVMDLGNFSKTYPYVTD